MNCNCGSAKCYYKEHPEFNRSITPLSCDEPCFVLNQITIKDEEIILLDSDFNLKKYIVNHDMTLSCKYSIELSTSYITYNSLRNIDNYSFLYYTKINDSNEIFICCALTGQVQYSIEIKNASILDVKYLNGFLLIIVSKNSDRHMNLYLLQEKKLVTNIKFESSIENQEIGEQIVGVFKNNYFVTQFTSLNKKFLFLWNITLDNKNGGKTTLKKVQIVTVEFHVLVQSSGDCIITTGPTFVKLYKLIKSRLVLINEISKIFESSLVNTLSIIPTHQHNALVIQSVKTRKPPTEKLVVTFHNFLNDKSYQVVNHDFFPCSFASEHCEYDHSYVYLPKYYTIFLLGEKSFKLRIDPKTLGHIYSGIRKYAQVLAQAWRTKTSLFSTLPLELVIAIICETCDNEINDYHVMKKVALQYFK